MLGEFSRVTCMSVEQVGSSFLLAEKKGGITSLFLVKSLRQHGFIRNHTPVLKGHWGPNKAGSDPPRERTGFFRSIAEKCVMTRRSPVRTVFSSRVPATFPLSRRTSLSSALATTNPTCNFFSVSLVPSWYNLFSSHKVDYS